MLLAVLVELLPEPDDEEDADVLDPPLDELSLLLFAAGVELDELPRLSVR
ncbi:hypothetical protein GCM10010406_44060 [Streptomyces thermolineatus]|uniref:Segregation/condensation protein A n=1 Tax=Streptomyces thermolineatus TaxID=44033 RepID=A0ABP5ZXI4_9ACTN